MTKDTSDLKVAIVCDWLTGIGGAERVVLALHKLYPDAPIYTSQYDPVALDWFKDADVRTTWLQKLPKSLKKFLPVLRAWSFSHLDLSKFDLVISSAGAEAKGVKTGPDTVHITYCHAPTHYCWSRYDEYLAHPGFGVFNPLARLGLRLLVGPMRRWDHRAAQRPDYFIANSNHIQKEIKKYYGRDAVVIHPPVDAGRFNPTKPHARKGFVITGRQTPYKRVDLAVAACSEIGAALKVIGTGPDHKKLVDMAGPSVAFLTDVSDADMPGHFQLADAFIFPGLDDFGITAVEAMAAGAPVIAFQGGGALDYVIDGQTGLFFKEQTVPSLVAALKNFKQHSFNEDILVTQANRFSTETFTTSITGLINNIMVK